MKSFFVKNGSVDLHVLENGARSRQPPSLLVVGGLWEPAERAIPLLSGVPGHVVALSLRGRGLSSTPASGYGLGDHLSDIAAIVFASTSHRHAAWAKLVRNSLPNHTTVGGSAAAPPPHPPSRLYGTALCAARNDRPR